MTDQLFDAVVGTLDAPMVIVTASDGRERSGCLVGFSMQCSITPCRWLVCISKENHTLGVAAQAATLAIHPLRADQLGLARLFGSLTDDAVDKFERCGWHDGPGGAPILNGCDWIAGAILERIDLGDHVGHLVEIAHVGHDHPAGPQLGFQAVRGMPPGHPA
jgi:flavin reductase (DIM6/NTAB) family NADH-FMN oxidoreductase RutF